MQHILCEIFSILVGIQHFEYTDFRYLSLNEEIDWKSVFEILFQHKASQSLYHDNIPSLQSLQCNVDRLDGQNIIQGLMNCYDEVYCNLNHFGMQIRWKESSQTVLSHFISTYLIPFMKLDKVQSNVKTMQFEWGEYRYWRQELLYKNHI